ncbi:hypothetical protein [Phaeovulum sp. NW3]|uniref:hypothetical protein n=1 Tax=Phaeovulum sp. NW3 TaxID=2934933 RepID=UPI00202099EB|nr:hypothetical protein [Phaeovulum sp. NW3]MCL7464229.1 hypothetical protein [Phaeovulum sp. NW3]
MKLELSRIRAGHWEGIIAAGAPPAPEVVHLDQVLPGLTVDAQPDGRWRLTLPIPAELLHDGVQTFVVRDAGSGDRIGHFTIIAGVPLDDDIRAELDLLRAELDMLKRAFRRHCAETGT